MRTKDSITLASALRRLRDHFLADPFAANPTDQWVEHLAHSVSAGLKDQTHPWIDEARFLEAVMGGPPRNSMGELWGHIAFGFLGMLGMAQMTYRGCLPSGTAQVLLAVGAICGIALWRWWHDIFGAEARYVRRLLTPPRHRRPTPLAGGGRM
jgi:hypothetical protein